MSAGHNFAVISPWFKANLAVVIITIIVIIIVIIVILIVINNSNTRSKQTFRKASSAKHRIASRKAEVFLASAIHTYTHNLANHNNKTNKTNKTNNYNNDDDNNNNNKHTI